MKFNKFFQTAAVFGFVVLLNSCSLEDFNRHYKQLDADDVRPFSYQFKNPEIAPGDTVELSVIFSGKKVKLEDISWRVNWNYITNRFGSSAPVNGFEDTLKIISKRIFDTHDGHSQTAKIKFVVPDSMLYKSYAIPESLEQMAAMYNFPNMPKIDSISTSKEGILNMFENLAKYPYLQKSIPDSLGNVIDGLAQIFSAMFEIYIDIPNIPRSKIRHTVRYHGKLPFIKGVYYNKNPGFHIKFLEEDKNDYSNSYSSLLYSGDTIKISLNRQKMARLLFLPIEIDSAISLEKAFAPIKYYNVKPEYVYPIWFFEGGKAYSKLWFSSSATETRSPFEDGEEGELNWFERVINIDYDKAKVGDTEYLFLVLFDDVHGVVYRPQGRTTLGFPVKFVE